MVCLTFVHTANTTIVVHVIVKNRKSFSSIRRTQAAQIVILCVFPCQRPLGLLIRDEGRKIGGGGGRKGTNSEKEKKREADAVYRKFWSLDSKESIESDVATSSRTEEDCSILV